MIPFTLDSADNATAALESFGGENSAYLAGGTTLLDLAKLHVLTPTHVVDVAGLSNTAISQNDGRVRLGAQVTMAQAAADSFLKKNYPLVTESLALAASAQIRNMATLGGNLLQRVRCSYFRDNHSPCNKREPGSGCAAIDGENRGHAILGTSDHCIAFHPSDFCVAMIALDATVHTRQRSGGTREIPFADFHLLPGDTPHKEFALKPGELIEAISFPELPYASASTYEKVRDRASYQFALASAAVAIEFEGDTVKDARVAFGGVATKPWRASEVEKVIIGNPLNTETLQAAGKAAVAGARTFEHNAYKVPLLQRTLEKALTVAATRA
ncbi:FAD binding domain-containing protein [Haloferula sargassicola]|uniref:Aldehyde oxidoreductase FAD-binding subunit PaoB n=1 Tax=Haloferula sargassicola TaxID=490096 RepID=A0ABP9UR86_9BACT